MIYVYALTPAPARLPEEAGLGGTVLQTVTEGGVAGVYSAAVLAPAASQEQLLGHEAVLESLMEVHDAVLPVRFGTRLEDEIALRQLLARHTARLTAAFEQVRGRVEIGVRALWDEQGPGPVEPAPLTGSGRSYLLARLAQERDARARREHADARAAALHEPLSRRAVADRLRVLPRPGTLMAGAYLLARDETSAFLQEVEGLARAHPALTVVPTGPWPPHSFAPDLEEHGD